MLTDRFTQLRLSLSPWLGLTLMLMAVPLAAEPPRLDLEACVRIAIDESPLLRAAEEGVIAATEALGVATAPYYPEVGVAAGYRRFDTHLFFPTDVPLLDSTLGTTDDWSSALTVGYTLYDHGQRRAEQDSALATQAASEDDARRVRQSVVHTVHRAYYGVLSTQAAITAAQTALERGRDHFELAEDRKETGAVLGPTFCVPRSKWPTPSSR